MQPMNLYEIALGTVAITTLFTTTALTRWRTVVPTNQVHIVQSGRKTTSYGSGLAAGNVYYRVPASIPRFGITVTDLPVSVFDLTLKDYNGYDKGRVPFVLDLMGFFRISDTNLAAARVPSFMDLKSQMVGILQGATRTILATSEIEQILQDRAIFGEKFTTEVAEQLKQWGVEPVKSIELMDIRDAQGSKVIDNIMSKKKSLIESESRQAIAQNNQVASLKEIEAQQIVGVRQQEALEQVGLRTAQKDQAVGIQTQTAAQAVKEQEKITAEKGIAVQSAIDVGRATIEKGVKVVAAEAAKQVTVTTAEGTRQQTILAAEASQQAQVLMATGQSDAMKKVAEGIEAEGRAKGEAEKALQLASVTAQTTLADKIGENDKYQAYLVTVRQIEAAQAVGVAQAEALTHADVKIISTAGSPPEGMKSAMDLFGAKGGLALGAFVEAFKATPAGEKIVNGLGG